MRVVPGAGAVTLRESARTSQALCRESGARRGGFDLGLEAGREAQRDPRVERVVPDLGLGLGGLAADVDEVGVASGHADVDVPVGQLCGDVARGLAEHVQQHEQQWRLERAREPLGGADGMLVADFGQRGEGGLQGLDVWFELHGVILTAEPTGVVLAAGPLPHDAGSHRLVASDRGVGQGRPDALADGLAGAAHECVAQAVWVRCASVMAAV